MAWLTSVAVPRVLALLLFCHFSVNNGFAWLLFDPVAMKLSETFPALTTRHVELLSSWQPIVYLVMFYPLTVLQSSNDGIRRAVMVASCFEVVGSAVKFLASTIPATGAAVALLHVGQICSAVASPVAIGAPAALSATWFSAEYRTRATAAAVLSNNVGNAIAFALVPEINMRHGFQAVVLVELCSACLLFVAVLLFFPLAPFARHVAAERPAVSYSVVSQVPAPLEDTADATSDAVDYDITVAGPCNAVSGPNAAARSVRHHITCLLSLPAAVILCVAYSWSSGSYVAWTSMYEELLSGVTPRAPGQQKGSRDVFIGFVTFGAMMAYVTGGLVTSYVTDRYLGRHMKRVILFCAVMNTICVLLFVACLPHRDSMTPALIPVGTGVIALLAALCGWFNGSAAPLFYELLAEISFPVPETVSGNLLSVCENAGALLMYQVVLRGAPSAYFVSVVFGMGMGCCAVGVAFVKERYLRPRSDGVAAESAAAAATAMRNVVVDGDEVEMSDDDIR